MKPRQVHEARDDIQILDVRKPYEWHAGHIEGSRHIPMDQLQQRQEEIAQDRTVVCVCRSGARSGRVANALSRAGYRAANMDGGLEAWSAAGLPLVADGDRHPTVA